MKLQILLVVVIFWCAVSAFRLVTTIRLNHQLDVLKTLKFKSTEKYSVFHVPDGGCPSGTTLNPEMFRLGGKPVPGCFDADGNGSIDVLRPGESFSVFVPVEPATPGTPKKGGRI